MRLHPYELPRRWRSLAEAACPRIWSTPAWSWYDLSVFWVVVGAFGVFCVVVNSEGIIERRTKEGSEEVDISFDPLQIYRIVYRRSHFVEGSHVRFRYTIVQSILSRGVDQTAGNEVPVRLVTQSCLHGNT